MRPGEWGWERINSELQLLKTLKSPAPDSILYARYPASVRRGAQEIAAVGKSDCFVQCCILIVGATAITEGFKSGRESYGDSAIGFVQAQPETNLCRVKANVTPQHKISKKGYGVTVICNEEDEVVLSALCDSCAVSLGVYNGFPDLNYIYLL
ncbi:hypothetical protein AVEN_64533-1 [Araneus ventricosus]|uniref:Uncharacterized protein n=1 Tax=Araneus ventricosus TaxID=182803 RepID=A0A4Y2MIR0_ARAVE|nr:hypothetical protein AVEN_64533-1 [Araneus ventricosus]